MKSKIIPLRIIAVILVIIQIAAAIIYADTSPAALSSVKYATSVYENGGFILKAPWMSFIGLISKAAKIHPLILIHTVLPVIVISLAYFSYFKLFKNIFAADERYACYAFYASCFLNVYGYQSKALSSVTLLIGYFNGACILLHVILPAVLTVLISKIDRSFDRKKEESIDNTQNETDDAYMEEWDMKKHPVVNARNLAIALGVVVVVLIASIFVLNNKINKLYDATVNLQNQIENYESSSEDVSK